MKKVQSISGKTVIAAVALLILVSLFVFAYFTLRPSAVSGNKTIHVEVINPAVEPQVFEIHTDAEYLKQALDEKNLIQGETGSYGFFVTTVNGVTADDSLQEWWCFTKDGESLMTSVSDTPINDGERYEITLVTGY